MNATRFALPPLAQPTYSFGAIPRASYPDLKGSTLECVRDREYFQRCMAEMVLVCKEAVRRQRSHRNNSSTPNNTATTTADGSKPLSLEYLADRLDVDEPLWGYVVRHEQGGRMQGFICVTTFTNYEQSFRWDSLNEDAAFADDNPEEQRMRLTGERKVDTSGELARQLQATVRTGNVWQEGIVWPRIAEISLLGALGGCGRFLVELVLEDLERMKASSKVNYEYVVLQATDNSISFYETLGFVRVGAIVERDDNGQSTTPKSPMKQRGDGEKEPAGFRRSPKRRRDDSNPITKADLELPDCITMSKFQHYEVSKVGEPLQSIAKKFKVDVFDIIFLNEMNYPDLVPGSRLIKGTLLRIPDYSQDSLRSIRSNFNTLACNSSSGEPKKWHVAKENDTPRSIAKMYNLDYQAVVHANKNRLKGLLANSRLKQGTQVRISHLDAPDIAYVPYAHWSFPDDDHFEEGEPSYMMALSLKRQRGAAAKSRPVRERLAIPITETNQPPANHKVLHVPPHVSQSQRQVHSSLSPSNRSGTSSYSDATTTTTGFALFESHYRMTNPNLFKASKSALKAAEIINDAWRNLEFSKKIEFVQQSSCLRQQPLAISHCPHTPSNARVSSVSSRNQPQIDSQENLFNMVVRIDSTKFEKEIVDVDPEEYEYWYVLTFIPDLRWCHLAPMVQDGLFGPEKPKAYGRPKWKLVKQELGKELDISSSFCIPCRSKSMKRTLDADKEEWDILSDDFPSAVDCSSSRGKSIFKASAKRRTLCEPRQTPSPELDGIGPDCRNTQLTTTTSKASRKRKRNSSSPGDDLDEVELVATLHDLGWDVRVKLTGLGADEIFTEGEAKIAAAPSKQPKEKSTQNKLMENGTKGAKRKRGRPRKVVVADGQLSDTILPSYQPSATKPKSPNILPPPSYLDHPLAVAASAAGSAANSLEQRVELTTLTTCCIFVGDM
ncbi:hypothetical protein ACA910_000731 [Epithemia clementina (nom. ined.)]